MAKTKLIWKCPHCDLQTSTLEDLEIIADHMWDCHGVPYEFTINGKTYRSGPEALLDRWAISKFRQYFPLDRNLLD